MAALVAHPAAASPADSVVSAAPAAGDTTRATRPADRDSVRHALPDTAGVGSVRGLPRVRTWSDSLARADSARVGRAGRFDQPRWVMARSLVVPGWGQVHNRAWLKAALVAFGESWLILQVVRDEARLGDLNAEVDAARRADDLEAERVAVDRYNAVLDRFVGRQWLLAGLVTYALMDAYVDAHFVRFKFEFERDPALPEGLGGARIALERTF